MTVAIVGPSIHPLSVLWSISKTKQGRPLVTIITTWKLASLIVLNLLPHSDPLPYAPLGTWEIFGFLIQNPKSTHITPILKSLHWLKVSERIEYKLLSLTYKVITTAQPSYLHNLISLQPPRSTRSSSVVTLSRPPTISSLKITYRSFRFASPRLWNQLPDSFRQPHHSRFDSPPHPLLNSSLSSSPLSSVVIHHSFSLSLQAQNLPFQQILPTVDFFYLLDCLTITGPDRTYYAHDFIFSFTF